ncbi:MAG: signal recognition particle-docking protein FtsY [Gammaproteobacteria bacterium]
MFSSQTKARQDEGRPGFVKRLRARLNRGDSWLTYDLANLVPGRRIDAELIDELETRLLTADVGVEATERIIGGLNRKVARKELADVDALIRALHASMVEILAPCAQPLAIDTSKRPFVILMVGVNGAGKTTTIGKLAAQLKDQGHRLMLAAGDTFRAAAVEQLEAWGRRNGVPVIAQQPGADPAAVVFDAMQAARARDIDVLIADTAGRLHSQSNLMEELGKVNRVIRKLDPDAPHETMLVLDGGTGQNALAQAREFHDAIGVTGITLTKLDGTAKGGILLALAERMKLPIRFIGVGEQAADLGAFDAHEFVGALLAAPGSKQAGPAR